MDLSRSQVPAQLTPRRRSAARRHQRRVRIATLTVTGEFDEDNSRRRLLDVSRSRCKRPNANAKLSFEAASIKPAPPPDGHGMRVGMQGGPGTSDPERVTFENFTLSALIGTAYDVKWYQMPGLDMLDANRFNITATLVPGATKEQFRLMLRNLLAERFQLAVHKEMREIPIYALTVAKNGPKLKKAAADPQDDAAAKDDSHPGARMAKDSDGFPILLKGMTMAITGNRARLGGPKRDHRMAYRSIKRAGPTAGVGPNWADRRVRVPRLSCLGARCERTRCRFAARPVHSRAAATWFEIGIEERSGGGDNRRSRRRKRRPGIDYMK